MIPPEVWVPTGGVVTAALIAGATAVRAARVAGESARRSEENQRYMKEHIGEKNGRGTVTEMLELVLDRQDRMFRAQTAHDLKDGIRFGALFTHLDLRDPLRDDTTPG